ncbi:MAG: hypothetical protein LIO58_04020 [Oscillospiraceae bacterium]|nr:hypothetical protein [Oscillospiraceae bacterium]
MCTKELFFTSISDESIHINSSIPALSSFLRALAESSYPDGDAPFSIPAV